MFLTHIQPSASRSRIFPEISDGGVLKNDTGMKLEWLPAGEAISIFPLSGRAAGRAERFRSIWQSLSPHNMSSTERESRYSQLPEQRRRSGVKWERSRSTQGIHRYRPDSSWIRWC